MKYINITKGRGDTGYTDLCLGGSVLKTDSRIEVVGEIDEFHATIGLFNSELNPDDRLHMLEIQSVLTQLMGEISCKDENKERYLDRFGGITDENTVFLDTIKDDLATELDKKQDGTLDWSLYGEKGQLSAKIDFSGTVCRRCERHIIGLRCQGFSIRDVIVVYMNRLSKVLYLLARKYENYKI